LTKSNQLPLIFSGHGICVLLAKEANIVGAFQLLDGRRILSEPSIVELDRALVLASAADEFFFAVALDLRANGREDSR
jgi:hypothetical protein